MPKMTSEELEQMLTELPDGEFIDLIYNICQASMGLSIEEWIEHEYRNGDKAVSDLIDGYKN